MSIEDGQSVWDHLEELAQRLRKALFVVVVATVAVVALPTDFQAALRLDLSNYRPLISTVMEVIQEALLPEGVNLIAFNWLDTFYIYFLVAIAIGVLVTLPFLAYELYQFIRPALYPHERRSVYSFVILVTLLFAVGAAYAWFILLPTTFNVLYRFVYQSRVLPFFSVKDFFNMVAIGLLGSGLFYTFPVVIWMLVRADLIEVQTLKDSRKQIFVGLIVVTAVLTPDPTPFSMLLMSVPFYVLYEISIQILGRVKQPNELVDEGLEMGIRASKELLERMQVQDEPEKQKSK
ncbi:MAG: twin-arginine translocase subunit TatC [Candidatus Bathyarchaeota archaeon]|nr:MAG: twin-arginine translocase subunit TatC [Candidatus Bathyarchaeota archaeon]